MALFQRPTVSAAHEALNEVILKERLEYARYVTVIRLAATIAGTLLFAVIDAENSIIAVSRAGAWLYFMVAGLIATAIFAFPKTAVASSYAIAFIDVPLLSFVHHLQLGPLGELRYHNVPPNLVMMSTLIVAASLTMSLPVILCTTTTAGASMILMLYRCDFPLLPILLSTVGSIATAVMTSLMVIRIRRLAIESRSRDLLGKYVLGERIGMGGMAEVFRATYCPEGGFERRVAVKRIHPQAARDPKAIALFRREAELGATLAHPNLVQVLDFGADGASYFLAMELVDGCSLQQMMLAARSERRPFEVKAISYLAWCLAEALQHLHEHVGESGEAQGLVHRDVNPPNVLISKSGDVKLTDFGIARGLHAVTLTAPDLMRGKLAYAAPEQVRGETVDVRADLFALGLTLWEMSAGERVFHGASEVELMRAVLEQPLSDVRQVRPALPVALAEAIAGLLERDLTRRTPSARAFLQQLSTLATDAFDVREGRRLLSLWVTQGQALMAPTQIDGGSRPAEVVVADMDKPAST